MVGFFYEWEWKHREIHSHIYMHCYPSFALVFQWLGTVYKCGAIHESNIDLNELNTTHTRIELFFNARHSSYSNENVSPCIDRCRAYQLTINFISFHGKSMDSISILFYKFSNSFGLFYLFFNETKFERINFSCSISFLKKRKLCQINMKTVH